MSVSNSPTRGDFHRLDKKLTAELTYCILHFNRLNAKMERNKSLRMRCELNRLRAMRAEKEDALARLRIVQRESLGWQNDVEHFTETITTATMTAARATLARATAVATTVATTGSILSSMFDSVNEMVGNEEGYDQGLDIMSDASSSQDGSTPLLERDRLRASRYWFSSTNNNRFPYAISGCLTIPDEDLVKAAKWLQDEVPVECSAAEASQPTQTELEAASLEPGMPIQPQHIDEVAIEATEKDDAESSC